MRTCALFVSVCVCVGGWVAVCACGGGGGTALMYFSHISVLKSDPTSHLSLQESFSSHSYVVINLSLSHNVVSAADTPFSLTNGYL
jgi:hypothetical protein